MKRILIFSTIFALLFTTVSPAFAYFERGEAVFREALNQEEMKSIVGATTMGSIDVQVLAPAGNGGILGNTVTAPVKYSCVVTSAGAGSVSTTVKVFNTGGALLWESESYPVPQGESVLITGEVPITVVPAGVTDYMLRVTAINSGNGVQKAMATTQFNVY